MPISCRAHAAAALLASSVVALTGCQSTGRLAEYDFAGRTLYAVYDLPMRAEVLTGPLFDVPSGDPVRDLMRAGAMAAREIAAADIRDRLDAASERVDLPVRVGERLGPRAARYLRTELVEDEAEADFGLEVRIREYGIDAERWEAAAHFFVEAQVILYDGADGRTIWESKVKERDPMAPAIFGGRRARFVRDVVTAAVLADMSEDEIVVALEALADYAADHISERLRDSLDEVRGR